MDLDKAKAKISSAFSKLFGVSKSKAMDLLPAKLTAGKAYEAYVLAIVCEQLKMHEGCTLRLVNGSKIVLKSSHGGINRAYPWIEVNRSGAVLGEIFTDIEFLTLSYFHSKGSDLFPGHFHELDIALVEQGATGRPRHDQIRMAVECKNTTYNKGLLKEILGIRRELSLLSEPQQTYFNNWPITAVPAKPPSCLLAYSTSEEIEKYSHPGHLFGIDFKHVPF